MSDDYCYLNKWYNTYKATNANCTHSTLYTVHCPSVSHYIQCICLARRRLNMILYISVMLNENMENLCVRGDRDYYFERWTCLTKRVFEDLKQSIKQGQE